jgi:hypothetical protein
MALRRPRRNREDPFGLSYQALTGATAQVTLDAASSWKTWKFGNRDWQAEGWRLYDIVPEHHFLTGRIGDSVAQARLYVTQVDDTGEETGEVTDDRISRLAAIPLGTGAARDENLRLAGVDLAVGGECWIVGEGAAALDPEQVTTEGSWFVVTGEAFKRSGGGPIKVKRPKTKGGDWLELQDGTDILIRCWRAHPNDTDQADSFTRSAIVPLREIELLTKREFAELDSRLTGAGIMFLPEGVDFPRGKDDPADLAGFMAYLQRAAAASMKDQSNARAMVPIMATVPDEVLEHLDKLKPITFWSELSEQITPMKDKAIERLARSAEIPGEVLTGIADSNHWTAWLISEEGIRWIKGYLGLIADALTRGFLRPALVKLGIQDPEHYAFAFDTAPLAVKPNRTDDAMKLHDKHLITDEEAVKAAAFDPAQMPTVQQRVLQMLVAIVPNHPELLLNPGVQAALGFPLIETVGGSTPVGSGQDEEEPEGQADGPPNEGGPEEPEDEDQAAAIKARLDARIRELSAAPPSPERVFNAAAKLMIMRALELAGGRLTTPAERRGRWADIPRHELHVRVGPVTPDKADKVTEGAWTHLPLAAAELDVNPAELERLLAGYVHELLTRGMAHHDDLLYATLSLANRGRGLLEPEPVQGELVAA